jgi:predicted helicase
MSKILINQYYQNLDRTLQFGKSRNEQSIRNHFWALLNEYARKFNYEVVPEVAIMGTKGKKVHPDGTVKNLWGLDIGLWESKDEKDDIEAEIDAKIKKGYPLTNILFEDSNVAVLFQRGEEVAHVKVRDSDELHQLLDDFFSFKSDIVYKFEDAIEKFKADIPIIVETLRNKILESRETNKNFLVAQASFFELCKVEINPDITIEDIREMLIQHILTSDIFNKIFDDPEFHLHNTIAAELEKLIGILFTYEERKNLLYSIEHYYEAINSTAASITDHHEKQKFLKVLYENFYKVYNPKAADRLGVVYTPNEIVQFMVQNTDYLLQKYFDKTLADKNVEILDPATGTGTFICEIIENAIPKHLLDYKFRNEIHANEVAILPYYIANLNIEFTFKQKMQYYAEFPNLCFVDTLDNISALAYVGKQHEMFGVTSENTERIKRQNSKKISVIIGNPPYNANQLNENENNKNREYPFIDGRIKKTYIKQSTAQKTKVYDMYARFLRWASDRIDKNGIVSFVSNNSFINSRTFDGFRKVVTNEFNEIWIIDLKGNARTSGEQRRKEGGNVFSDLIRVGIAVYFLLKKENDEGCRIYYTAINDYAKAEEKKEYLQVNKLQSLSFEKINPDKNNNWINLSEDNDWNKLIPLIDKQNTNTLFNRFSNGINTARDEWVYDFDIKTLEKKAQHFKTIFNSSKDSNSKIKWSRDLKLKLKRKLKVEENRIDFEIANYRPYVKMNFALNEILVDVISLNKSFFTDQNLSICCNVNGKDLRFIASNIYPDWHFIGDTKCIPLFYYTENCERIENITDWALKQFVNHYEERKITKGNIFHYTYSVLHNPAYRKKYELNLKREFPRLPFYENFWQWVDWGKRLMDLHLYYENVNPFPLEEHTYEVKAEEKRQKEFYANLAEPDSPYAHQPKIKVKLNANKDTGIIEIDELTFLSGVPKKAWDYKLGNRSALEWILDQYKEKKPKDPTIAEKFNTYRFEDYKDKVIDLLKRVCTVSVETVRIIKEMEQSTDSN